MTVQEAALLGYTHVKTITAADLTSTTSGGAETENLFTIPKDGCVDEVLFYLKTEFDGASSSDLAITVGDDDDADGFIASATIHADGTAVSSKINTGAYFTIGSDANTGNCKVYDNAATKTLSAVFTPTGDSNSDISTGEVVIAARIRDFSEIK